MMENNVFLYFFIMDDGQKNSSCLYDFSGEDIMFGKKVT